MGIDQDVGYFNGPLVKMAGNLDTSTDLLWQYLGLWGNERDSEYKYWSLVAMNGTLDTFTDL